MATTIEKFLLVGTQAKYDALTSKDSSKLYFCSDTLNMYKGADLYTDGIRKVSTKPTSAIAKGVLYYITGTDTLEMYDGSAWTVVRPAISKSITASSTDSQLATAKSIYDFVTGAIADLAASEGVISNVTASSTKSGVIEVTKGSNSPTEVTLSGVVANPTYDATTRTITLPVTGGDTLTIALGKDVFLDSTKANQYNATTKNIELYLNDGSKIEIPASGLIDVYTGGTTNTATVSVSDSNVITAAVKISSKTGNAITTDSSNGLYLSLSAYETVANVESKVSAVQSNLDTTDANVTANTNAISTLNGSSTTAGSVDYKIAAAQTTITGTTDALEARIKALEDAFGFGTF
jgi:hypothetical protein